MTTVAIVLALAAAAEGAAAPAASIEQVRWLAGCWESAAPEKGVEEYWMAPRGKTMLGVGRTVRGEKLVEYELVLLREEGAKLAYEAHPSGQAPAVFLSREVGDSRVVFENLEHDFPQRVGYQLDGPDTLTAWIEGTSGGKTKRIDFPYKRAAACGVAR
jgi:hypothetical protein